MASFTAVQKLIGVAEVVKDQLTIISAARSRADSQDTAQGVWARGATAAGPHVPSQHHPDIPLALPGHQPGFLGKWDTQCQVMTRAAHRLVFFASIKWGDKDRERVSAWTYCQETSTMHGKHCPSAKRSLWPAGLHRSRTLATVPPGARPVRGARRAAWGCGSLG